MADEGQGIDVVTLQLAKKFVRETALGLGAVMGKPCQVRTVVEEDGTHTICNRRHLHNNRLNQHRRGSPSPFYICRIVKT